MTDQPISKDQDPELEAHIREVHSYVTEYVDEAITTILSDSAATEEFYKEGQHSTSTAVTRADVWVDEFLRRKLAARFPQYSFVSEEGGADQDSEPASGRWIIDSIDGTRNFSRGEPLQYGISVALWKNGEPIYGMVAIPRLKTKVWAGKGMGAFEGDTKLWIPDQKVLPSPYVTVAAIGSSDEVGSVIAEVTQRINHPQDYACCVYQAYLTVRGNADVFVGYHLSIWDLGAIVLLAQEAGALLAHTPFQFHDEENAEQSRQCLIFGKPELTAKVIDLIKTWQE
jgi:fructose-1,6-bisphosphatase/inositol monophosphatase family enzyme